MLYDFIQRDVISLTQASYEFNQSLHLCGRRPRRAASAVCHILGAEISYQTDPYQRVIANRVRSLTTLGATRLHRSIRKNDVVVAHVIKSPPIKDAETTLPVNFIEHSHIQRGAIPRKWNGRMMNYDACRCDCI